MLIGNLFNIGFKCENEEKPNFPWYYPYPDKPTPPKGSSLRRWNPDSFITTAPYSEIIQPEEVSLIIFYIFGCLFVP